MICSGTLKVRNFLSFGPVTQEIDLSQLGVTTIYGEDRDAGDNVRIGAGKSSIFEAVSFAIFNKSIKPKLTTSKLINNISKKGLFVSYSWTRGDISYTVERSRKIDALRFLVGNKEWMPEDKAQGADAQMAIEAAFGMSHLMFTHIVAMNTATTPFLGLEAEKQRGITEELLNAHILTDKAKILKNRLSLNQDDFKIMQAEIRTATTSNDRIQSALMDAQRQSADFESNRDTQLAKSSADLAQLLDVDVTAELAKIAAYETYLNDKREAENKVVDCIRACNDVKSLLRSEESKAEITIRAMQSEIDSGIQKLTASLPRAPQSSIIYETRVASHKKDAVNAEKEVARLFADIEKANAALDTARGNLANPSAHECDRCGQTLEGTNHLETILNNIKAEISRLEKQIVDCEEQALVKSNQAEESLRLAEVILVEQNSEKITYNEAVSKIETELSVLRAQRAQPIIIESSPEAVRLAQERAEAETAVATAESYVRALAPPDFPQHADKNKLMGIASQISVLEKDIERLFDSSNPYTDQISNMEKAITVIDTEAAIVLEKTIRHREHLLKLLTDRNSYVRKRVIERNLKTVNDRLKHYMACLRQPFGVRVESDLRVSIERMGKDYDYGQISRGETNGLNMAVALAFRDAWEEANEKIDLLVIDELLDFGLCTQTARTALELLLDMAKTKPRAVYLITHRDEFRGGTDHCLTIVKEAEFSTIEIVN